MFGLLEAGRPTTWFANPTPQQTISSIAVPILRQPLPSILLFISSPPMPSSIDGSTGDSFGNSDPGECLWRVVERVPSQLAGYEGSFLLVEPLSFLIGP